MSIYHACVGNHTNLRSVARYVNPDEEDFVFQILDANISFFGSETDESGVRRSEVFLHGVNDNANTALVRYAGYISYFYLSLPEGDPDRDYQGVYTNL